MVVVEECATVEIRQQMANIKIEPFISWEALDNTFIMEVKSNKRD
jgi:hypothetical protein